MLYGTRISLTIGVVAVGIYVWIGVVLGALAGYLGGWWDVIISRLIEVMICIPSFFLILTLVALVEDRSIFQVMVIIGVTSWTGVARLVRAEFLQQRELEYALAARALGLPRWRVIFRHILPNALGPVLVSATFGVASAILIESSLAFLGLGDPSVPSWGETLNVGRLEMKYWLIFAPGLAIFFVVSVFNLVGEGLRDALDPKLRT
ncbi:MAG: peptide ABC transporter permease [Deltaproteobacteria bacterium]|nr:peptide ABC transporter permease [Deltaproteobacteria bacterium]